jgi:tRNA(adenine34) deaminase
MHREHRVAGAGAALADPHRRSWARSDEYYMRRAIGFAKTGMNRPGRSPIGCVIVLGGLVVGEGCNQVGCQHDPTAHAEIVAIRRATKSLAEADLRGATLYSTLQPCGMCTMASIWARIGRIVYGAGRDQVHDMYFEDRHFDIMDFIEDAFRDDLQVRSGVLGRQCAQFYFKPDDHVPVSEQGNI